MMPAGTQQLRAQDPAPVRRCGTEGTTGHPGREGRNGDGNRDEGGGGNAHEDRGGGGNGSGSGDEIRESPGIVEVGRKA